MRKFLPLTLLLVLFVPALHAATKTTTTIILVRHAEKGASTGDPSLSDVGKVRAAELARVLVDAGVQAIYTTQYNRTRETAIPLADATHIVPMVIQGNKEYAAALVADILGKHQGQTVIAIGHSNTIPEVLTRLGVKTPPEIADTQFDDLFVCRVANGEVSLLHLRYGAVGR